MKSDKRIVKSILASIICLLLLQCCCSQGDTVRLKHGDVYVLEEDVNAIYRFLCMETDEQYKSAYVLNDLSEYDTEEYITPDFINGIPMTMLSSEKDFDSSMLKRIIIGNQVRYLGSIHVKSLQFISIGENVSLIMSPTFLECANLKKVQVDNRNPFYYSENNSIIETATKKIIAASNGTTSIPRSSEIIGKYSFTGVDLINIVVTSNISKIEKGAFQQCRKLKALFIPSSVHEIEETILIDWESNREIDIFCECKDKPNDWAEDWYYIIPNSCYGDQNNEDYKKINDSLVTIHWGATIDDYYEFVNKTEN